MDVRLTNVPQSAEADPAVFRLGGVDKVTFATFVLVHSEAETERDLVNEHDRSERTARVVRTSEESALIHLVLAVECGKEPPYGRRSFGGRRMVTP